MKYPRIERALLALYIFWLAVLILYPIVRPEPVHAAHYMCEGAMNWACTYFWFCGC